MGPTEWCRPEISKSLGVFKLKTKEPLEIFK